MIPEITETFVLGSYNFNLPPALNDNQKPPAIYTVIYHDGALQTQTVKMLPEQPAFTSPPSRQANQFHPRRLSYKYQCRFPVVYIYTASDNDMDIVYRQVVSLARLFNEYTAKLNGTAYRSIDKRLQLETINVFNEALLAMDYPACLLVLDTPETIEHCDELPHDFSGRMPNEVIQGCFYLGSELPPLQPPLPLSHSALYPEYEITNENLVYDPKNSDTRFRRSFSKYKKIMGVVDQLIYKEEQIERLAKYGRQLLVDSELQKEIADRAITPDKQRIKQVEQLPPYQPLLNKLESISPNLAKQARQELGIEEEEDTFARVNLTLAAAVEYSDDYREIKKAQRVTGVITSITLINNVQIATVQWQFNNFNIPSTLPLSELEIVSQ